MYFSRGKTLSAEVSMTDISSQRPVVAEHLNQRLGSSIKQKNKFNYNIYFTSDHLNQSSSSAKIEDTFSNKLSMDSLSFFASTTTSKQVSQRSLNTNYTPQNNGSRDFLSTYSLSKENSSDNQNMSSRMQMIHKQSSKVNTMRAQSILNGSSSIGQFHFGKQRSSEIQPTQIKLIGFIGDPEFQSIKEVSLKITSVSGGKIIIKIDEIHTEVDYDQRLKQLKRSSSQIFLPAYKNYKSTIKEKSTFQNSNGSPRQGILAAMSSSSATSAFQQSKRPYYFLTDDNKPVFSLQSLSGRILFNKEATLIIEQYLETKNSLNPQSQQQQQAKSMNSFDFLSSASALPVIEVPSFSSSTSISNIRPQSFSSLSSLPQISSQSKLSNFIVDDKGDKKIVYLSIRTSQKYRESPLHSVSSLDQKSPFAKSLNIPFMDDQTGQTSNSSLNNYNEGETFKLVIELYTKVAPKACENFIKLCEGFISNDGNYHTFRNTQALRFKKNGFVQFGHSKPGISIFNGFFEDESFAIAHDNPGIVGYCNRGTPHTNSSQFYITLGEMKSFDRKMVAFGKVITGFKHFEKINKIISQNPSHNSEIPPFNIIICDSGIIQSTRPNSNRSRKSTLTSISLQRQSYPRLDTVLQDPELSQREDSYRVIRPDLFSYKGEKPSQTNTTYEQYIINEANKHKEVGIIDYIDLMMAFQSIAFAGQQLLINPFLNQSGGIEGIRKSMKEIFVRNLSECSSIALLYDICDDEVFIEQNIGKYIVAFTSLDANHMMDINCCGSMFLIYRKTTTSFRPAKRSDLLQSGEAIYGAGYIVYGQSTQIVFHTGFRLNGFTYDNENNIFVLTHTRIKGSKRSGIISCNEAQIHAADENVKKFIRRKKIMKDVYVSRYVGSRVADFHRTLLYGGILIYPQKEINIYEAFAFSYLIDKSWDRSSSGYDGQTLVKKPIDCQEMVQLYLGNSTDVLELDNLYLSIRRKNSLYKIHEQTSSKTIKSTYSIQRSTVNSPTKI